MFILLPLWCSFFAVGLALGALVTRNSAFLIAAWVFIVAAWLCILFNHVKIPLD